MVDGRHEEGIAVHILILGTFPQRVVVFLLHEHRANHRSSVDRHRRCRVGVGHQFTFQLEIPAVERRTLATECLRIFGIRAPSVHVEFHGREGFPLELAHVDRNVLSAENTIEVGGDVRLPRKTRADERGDVETDVLPIAARLIATPNTGVALCSRPTVERDDEGTSAVAVLRHDASDVGHAVEAEGIAPAHPSHVGLEHAYTGIAYLFDDVALKECFDAVFGMEVTLCPQSDFHTLRASVVTKLFKVLNIAVECCRLSVTGAVAVVGKEPSEWHVIVEITVNCGAS